MSAFLAWQAGLSWSRAMLLIIVLANAGFAIGWIVSALWRRK